MGLSGNQPPLNAKNKAGQIIGMDAALARLIADKMGVALKNHWFNEKIWMKELP
ncbi:MAG: transporter substrate-binding domain-containing protein [Deltaproteobacteria bacterium]|nr:transporter substrate-binding domain-containing protein [Deltaproteobacteria bacterium]